MVCLGNICRSPLAETILQRELAVHGIPATVDSCGTGNWHSGEAPDRRAMQVAQSNGIDISMLRARQLTAEDYQRFDFIFAMDRANYNDIIERAPIGTRTEHIHLFLDYAKIVSPRDVPDPYYGNIADFHRVYQLLEDASHRIIPLLRDYGAEGS